ncbi:hypothetical protein [Paracoccus sp. (in: a-proteobacteria)]|nr:hypothetical protein [Paracoccus sp. (in: a-proteobacteria)]
MRKIEPLHHNCPVRRVLREEARNLILVIIVLVIAALLRTVM